MKKLLILIITLIITSTIQASDIDTLKNRVIAELMITAKNVDISNVETYISTINSDGGFSDINYNSTTQTNWEPLLHLLRMRDMCYLYLVEGQNWYLNNALLGKIELGMNYWFTHDPVSTNWWFNEIGKQKQLNIIGILMMDYLSSGLLEKLVSNLSEEPSGTGANLTDVATSVIYRGLIEGNIDRINSGLFGIINEIVITTDEGIQTDYSFHQHGPLLYNRGYGYEFLKSTTYWCEKTIGTSFAYPMEKVEILSKMLLEGNRWMTIGKTMDYGTDGRGITRRIKSDGNALACINFLNRMAIADTIRQAELRESASNISNEKRQNINGNKHFWESDFTTHHREKFYTSVRMFSKRTKGTETINGENLKGYWLPFGTNFIFRKGNEYHNIFPLWNWGRLPGVTSPDVEINLESSVWQNYAFVGGVSDSLYGVSAMRFYKQQTRAKKAWFFFDDEWVALGSGITSSHIKEIKTTLNQAFLDPSLILVNGVPVPEGTYAIDSANWVMNDSIAYIFLEKKPISLIAEERRGTWSSINTTQSSDPVVGKTFTLSINHGRRPLNDKYAYAVVPGISPEEAESYWSDLPVKVIENSYLIQAVKHEPLDITGIVFYSPDSLSVDNTLKVLADASCIVMVRKLSSENYIVTVADPDENDDQITCTIYEGNNASTTIFDMPTGANKGKSLTLPVTNFTPTGITEIIQIEDITVYPNPAINEITIDYSGSGSPVYYTIFSMQGKKEMEGKITNNTGRIKLAIDNLTDGVYFITIKTSRNTSIHKLIKQPSLRP